jgi:hypothetical protein
MMARDERGRFKNGNPGGPGRPPKATEQEYTDAVFDVVPLSRFRKMIEAQAKHAERGDIRAFEVLCKYLAPVIEKHDLTSDGKPIQVIGLAVDVDQL